MTIQLRCLEHIGLGSLINHRVTVSRLVSDDGRRAYREVALPAVVLPATINPGWCTRFSITERRVCGVYSAAMSNRHAAWAAMVAIPEGHRWRPPECSGEQCSHRLSLPLPAGLVNDGWRLFAWGGCLFEVSDNATLIAGPEHAIVSRPVYDQTDPGVYREFAERRAEILARKVFAAWGS